MITCDGAGASHGLVTHLDKLAARPGHQLIYSVGWTLGEREKTALRLVPAQAWEIAIGAGGEIRERRAEDACANLLLRAPGCWIEQAHVTELRSLLHGKRLALQPVGHQPARRHEGAGPERLHRGRAPGAGPRGRRHPHRQQAGLGHFPSLDFKVNAAWLTASMIAATLLALDGDLAKAEPKTLRYRVLHTAAQLVRGGWKRCLKSTPDGRGPRRSRPRGSGSVRCRKQPDQHKRVPASKEGTPRGMWSPGHLARQPGHPTYPDP